jgi:CRP/FNR family transcriptional regulator, polysaccharide utilization system transcription regulator
MNIKLESPSCVSCQSRLNNVFCTLTDDQLTNLSVEKSCNIYKKGQLVFYEGNRPTGLYCVNKGKVKVYQIGTEGKEQIIRLAKDGDILGYRSLISGEMYTASASIIEDATICFIPKKTFFDLLQTNSDLSTRMMKLLSNDLKSAEKRITGLAQKPVRERMAETILMLKEFYGLDSEKHTIRANLSREDIANIVGTATETAIRILSEFRSEKMINLVGKRIQIVNSDALIKAANVFD